MNNTETAIIFDLDGTLIESAPDIHHAVNEMLIQIGKAKLSLEKVTSFIGNGVPKLIEFVMAEVEIPMTAVQHQNLVNEFSAFYAQKPVEKSYIYSGVRDLLETLKAEEYPLAICTNKPIDLTHKILDGLNLNSFFNVVIGGDSLHVKKPDPIPLIKTLELLDVSRCIYVGDSEVDASTADNAKQPFFLFTEGYRKSPAENIPADVRFDDFETLYYLIQQYLILNIKN